MTQLKLDKTIAKVTISTPLVLLALVSMFTPEAFKGSSLLCQEAQWYKNDPNLSIPTDCNENDPASCRSTEGLAYAGFHRGFANTGCWNNLKDFSNVIQEKWTTNKMTNKTKHEWVTHYSDDSDKEEQEESLINHALFPYFTLIIAAIISIPTLVWTNMHACKIYDQVIFLRESVEKLNIVLRNKKFDSKNGKYNKNYEERIMGQFKSIANWAQTKMGENHLNDALYKYRLINCFLMGVTLSIIYNASMVQNKSEFTCQVNYQGTHDEHKTINNMYVTCSIIGVGARVMISYIWFAIYLVSLTYYLFVLFGPEKSAKDLEIQNKNYNTLLDLFDSVMPGKFKTDNKNKSNQGSTKKSKWEPPTKTTNDLQYLVSLLSQNVEASEVVELFAAMKNSAMLGKIHQIEMDQQNDYEEKHCVKLLVEDFEESKVDASFVQRYAD